MLCPNTSELNSRDQSLFYGRVREDLKINYQELSAEFSNKAGYISVSYSTVRCLDKKGIDCYVAARKPLLRVTGRIKRYKRCKERLPWSVESSTDQGSLFLHHLYL